MEPDSERAIPFGLDPKTDEDWTIDLADPQKPYVCPQCGELLVQHRGTQVTHYFAHHPDHEARACPWYTGAGVRDYLNDKTTASLNAAQRIRLFIQTVRGHRESTLWGSIPPISAHDLLRMTQGAVPTPGSVQSEGTIREITFQRDLLPEEPSVSIAMNPDAPRFLIDVKPVDLSNGGTWEAKALAPGDVFVGGPALAERVSDPFLIPYGKTIFRIVGRGQEVAGVRADRFRLGKFDVLRIDVKPENLSTVTALVPGVKVDSQPFRIDVVYPFEDYPILDVRGLVTTSPGDEFLLALVPPAGKNPTLDLYIIPYGFSREKLEVPATGPGKPRFVMVKVDNDRPFRLLAQWPFFPERDFLVDFIPQGRARTRPLDRPEVACLLEVVEDGRRTVLDPLRHDSHEFRGNLTPDGRPELPSFSLLTPAQFRVGLTAEFPGDHGAPSRQDRGVATPADIADKLEDLFELSAREVVIDFESLGTVTLRCPLFYRRAVEEHDQRERAEAAQKEQARLAHLARLEHARQLKLAEARRALREKYASDVNAFLPSLAGHLPRHVSRAFVLALPVFPGSPEPGDAHLFRYLVRRWIKTGSAFGRRSRNESEENGEDGEA